MKRLRAVVHGRVQGVGYRASVYGRAKHLGIRGYVKNLPDGTVEIVADGEDSVLKDLLDIAWAGSPFSSVDRVETSYGQPDGYFDSFAIAY